MSGRNQYMWNPKIVNNLEKDINASAASDYLSLRVAVKHGRICPCCVRKCQDVKASVLVK